MTSLLIVTIVSAAAGQLQTTPATLQVQVWHSPGCVPCEQMRPAVVRLFREGEPITWVGTDKYPEAARAWNITQTPTTLLVVRGHCEWRRVGVLTYEQLKVVLDEGRRLAGLRSQDSPYVPPPVTRPPGILVPPSPGGG